MKWVGRNSFVVLILLLLVCVNASSPPRPTSNFDSFGDINCEDESARLDNFAIALQQFPLAQGYIIFYGGRHFRGRLPKLGEAEARVARLKPYLVNRRGIPSKRIIVIDGGFHEEWTAGLWIVPPGAAPPSTVASIPKSEIKFGRGRVTPRQFACRV